MDQERRALDLLDVVETGDADVAIREGLGGSLDFGEDFIGVLAAVHRELPHDPVAVVVVARVDGGVHARPAVAVSVGVGLVFELDARSPAVVEQVLDLLGDFGIGERRQEGEGLEHPNRGESKGNEERDIGQSSRSRKKKDDEAKEYFHSCRDTARASGNVWTVGDVNPFPHRRLRCGPPPLADEGTTATRRRAARNRRGRRARNVKNNFHPSRAPVPPVATGSARRPRGDYHRLPREFPRRRDRAGTKKRESSSLAIADVLVAVRAPDHHGLGVGDLAGGDGDGLGDLSLLGDSGHVDYRVFVSKSEVRASRGRPRGATRCESTTRIHIGIPSI